jgi:hypothetical protein
MAITLGEAFITLGVKPENLEAISGFLSKVGNTSTALGQYEGKTVRAEKATKSLMQRFRDEIGSLNMIRLQFLAISTAIVTLAEKAGKVAFELSKFSVLTGLSAEKLEVWQQQAAQVGISADEMASSIESLQKASVEWSMGEGNPAWAFLGIDPRQDPFAVLDQLKDKFKEFNPAWANKLGADLGLSKDMIYFLKEAKNLKPSDKSFLLSDKEISKLKEFHLFFNRIWDNSKRMLQKFGLVVMPIAEFILNAVDRLSHAFLDLGMGLNRLITNFQALAPILTIIFATLGVALFPVTALIIGLALAFEDVMTYLRGGDSITGRLIAEFSDLNNLIKDTLSLLAGLADTITGGMFSGEIGAWFDKAIKWADDAKGAGKLFGPADEAAAGVATGGMSKVDQTNNININISGAKNPKEIVREAQEKINKSIVDSFYQLPMGVK